MGIKLYFLTFLLLLSSLAFSQEDTVPENKIDSLLLKQKGLLGKLAQSIRVDNNEEEGDLQRADVPFQKYRNKIIRNIEVAPIGFGAIRDSSRKLSNTFTRLARGLHSTTREYVLYNYLFFRENDRVSPFLFGNNERYLRDLPFFQEARIRIRPVNGVKDSVDVVIETRDVLSLGGGFATNSPGTRLQLKEDNFMGWGDRLLVETMYDGQRNMNFGFGAEYTKRNLMGTFIDASVGFLNFNPSLSNRRKEEKIGFIRLVRPLANPFMRFTYSLSAELHESSNMFHADSIYFSNYRYRYHNFDGWIGWNPQSYDSRNETEHQRLRYLISLRGFRQQFDEKPQMYKDKYYYSYSDVTAVLTSVSVFRLNFYKTEYVYGFGRKEDLPEGMEASFTTGIVNRDGRGRQYLGFSMDHYFLSKKKQYISYSLKLATSLYRKSWEDITALGQVEYFSRLHTLGAKWKQRNFLAFNAGIQMNPMLEEPFLLESSYGLPSYNNNLRGGNFRSTVRGESVFFTPWKLFYFRFAPFIYGSATLMKYTPDHNSHMDIFPAVGGGLRTRNESLIFGTIELRASYFPKKDMFNNGYVIMLNTNIRFKYNQNFIRRPELIGIN